MAEQEQEQNIEIDTPDIKPEVKVFENEIEYYLHEYIDNQGIEDMRTESQSQWNACLLYIYKYTFKGNKDKLKSKGYKTNNNLLNNNLSNYNAYDIDIVNYICDIYINLCYMYDKEISINGFSKLTGIDYNTINEWGTMGKNSSSAIIPARVRAPKDKPNAEGTVGNISTWITAALRNEQFFSFAELNRAIRDKLELFNQRLFQKKEGSRQSLFLGEELPLLAPLPATRFELCDWKTATVQFNYHISVDQMLYSVPYEYIKKKVDVRVTDTTIEIFYNHNRIASHRRLKGRPGQYSTITAHMPEDHQKYLEWNGDRFRKWAEQIGINTYTAVNSILTSKSVEQQTYRSCMGLLKLADKYSEALLEAACKKALSYTASPSYKSIKNILATNAKKLIPETTDTKKTHTTNGITRGADYYRR